MRVSKFNNERVFNMPIFGAAADVKAGAVVKRGPTPATDNGMLILSGANTTASPDALGILLKMLDYSVDGETLIAGTAFVTRPVELFSPARIIRAQYDPATVISATQAVTTTTITLTSLEDNIDAAFLYVSAGLGIGQTNYLTASAAGSATLKAAFGTSLDTTSRLIKLLPRFHPLAGLSADGTMLGSYAAVGVHTVMILDTYIVRNGSEEQMSPVKHAALTGLNGLRSIRFEADLMFRDTIPASID